MLEEEYLVGLRLLQSLEPAGVGARNLQECLLLQLEVFRQACTAFDASESNSTREELLTASHYALARRLIEDHIETLGNANPVSLAKTLGETRTILLKPYDLFAALTPGRPGFFVISMRAT